MGSDNPYPNNSHPTSITSWLLDYQLVLLLLVKIPAVVSNCVSLLQVVLALLALFQC